MTTLIFSSDFAIFSEKFTKSILCRDNAVLFEHVIERHLIDLQNILDILIERTKQFPEVGFGDFVRSSHQNIIVDTLKLLSYIIDTYCPCPEFTKIVRKLRYVTKGDIILPEDHNLVVDALKELLKCYKRVAGEWDKNVMALEFQIGFLGYVKKGDPVLAFTQNTKYKALGIALKFIFRNVVILVKKIIDTLKLYFDYTIKSLDVLVFADILHDLTTRTLSKTLQAYTLYDFPPVISSISSILLSYDFPLVLSFTNFTVLDYDFPKIVSSLNQIYLSYNFPKIVSKIAEALTYSSVWIKSISQIASISLSKFATTSVAESTTLPILVYSHWLDLIQKELSLTLPYSLWKEVVQSVVDAVKTKHDTWTKLISSTNLIETLCEAIFKKPLTKFLPITSYGDAHLAIGPESYISLLYSFPTAIVSNYVQPNTILEFSDIRYDKIASIPLSLDFPKEFSLSLIATFKPDFNYIYYSLLCSVAPQLTLSKQTFDLPLQTPLKLHISTKTFDLLNNTSLILDKTYSSKDIIQNIDTILDKTTKDKVVEAKPSLLLDKTTKLTEKTGKPTLSYETDIIFWLRGFKYRRLITITNNAEEVSNYPILIILTPENFDYSKVKKDGSDIRFTKDDGVTKIPYWIETWNYGGTSYIWVLIDHLPLGDTHIFMYYGNPKAEKEDNPEAVFDFFDDFNKDLNNWKVIVRQGARNAFVVKL